MSSSLAKGWSIIPTPNPTYFMSYFVTPSNETDFEIIYMASLKLTQNCLGRFYHALHL